MCGGGGSPPPVDTYVGNGTKKGGKLLGEYGHNPAPAGDPFNDPNPDGEKQPNRMSRPGNNTQSGIKM